MNGLCQRMSDPSQHSFTKLKRLVRYLKGEGLWIQVFEFGNMSSRLRLGRGQRNEEIVKRGGRARGTTPFESVHKENKRSSPEAVQKNCTQQHWGHQKRGA